MTKLEKEFLIESNKIESVDNKNAHKDSFKAWNYTKKLKEIKVDDILKIHKLLMKNVYPEIAGNIRNCDVCIGGKRKFFVSECLIKAELEQICSMLKSKYAVFDAEKYSYARHCHVQFENIHPFIDGNGRVGRILYNWQRLYLGLPIHVIHAGKEQFIYYEWFK